MLFHPDDTRKLAIFEGNDISSFLNLGNRQPAALFGSSEFKAIIYTEGSVININSSLLSN